MNATNKRASKKQREVLLERLHANIAVVRGNQADEQAIEFWANLASELNVLGCSRTVQEWQRVWNVWVSKTKTKARKIRRSLHSTGGGPGIDAELDDTESKILEVVGSASVFGHDSIELGIEVPTQQTIPAPDVPSTSSAGIEEEFPEIFVIYPPVPSQAEPSQPVPSPSQTASSQPAPIQASPDLPRLDGRQPRSRRRGGSTRPRTHEALVQALNRNGEAWRETVLQAAHVIADAIRSLRAVTPATNPPPLTLDPNDTY